MEDKITLELEKDLMYIAMNQLIEAVKKDDYMEQKKLMEHIREGE